MLTQVSSDEPDKNRNVLDCRDNTCLILFYTTNLMWPPCLFLDLIKKKKVPNVVKACGLGRSIDLRAGAVS